MPATPFKVNDVDKIHIPEATQSSPGFLSSTDKAKIDSGLQASQSGFLANGATLNFPLCTVPPPSVGPLSPGVWQQNFQVLARRVDAADASFGYLISFAALNNTFPTAKAVQGANGSFDGVTLNFSANYFQDNRAVSGIGGASAPGIQLVDGGGGQVIVQIISNNDGTTWDVVVQALGPLFFI